MDHSKLHKLSFLGVIITLGIVYGDIGTSPLYVVRAMINENQITPELIYGGISCVFWTLALQASFKYITLALNADNNGEGGIFALFALTRRVSPKWMIYIAMIGCSALLADGIITPAISLTSAVEGLVKIYPSISHELILGIVIVILTALFTFQQFGTSVVGKTFGPIMVLWFTMLALLGIGQIVHHPEIFWALSPHHAISLLMNYPSALIIIGAVFLCVTGAEALYSDLGHCGKENIRIGWIFVKGALILNYLGQGAWLLDHVGGFLRGKTAAGVEFDFIPFYEIMPKWFLFPGIALATMATVIASQALITGSFSLINEAVKLKVWYRLNIHYPSEHRQQLYIPAINWLLYFGCLIVIFYFQESTKMEAAYGLAITIAMLSTTLLMVYYWLILKRKSIAIVAPVTLLFLIVEGGFMYANLLKLFHGAWVTLLLTGFFLTIMYVHYRAWRIRAKAIKYVKIDHYDELFKDLSADETIPRYATNLVFMINAKRKDEVEQSVIKSIFNNHQPKKADLYWFVNVKVTDEPYTKQYKVHWLIPDKLIRVDMMLGYRVHPAVNIMFKQIADELAEKGEISLENSNATFKKHKIKADFLYVLIEKVFAFEDSLLPRDKMTIRIYQVLDNLSISASEHFDLMSENLIIEKYPIRIKEKEALKLQRI